MSCSNCPSTNCTCLDDAALAGLIEQEGLDYAIQHYLDPQQIQDPETKRLWLRAKHALDALAKHLEV